MPHTHDPEPSNRNHKPTPTARPAPAPPAGGSALSAGRWALAALVTVAALNLLARGVSETFAVFLLPLEAEFGWDRATLTSVYAVYMLANGLTAPLAGLLFDRLGPRLCYGLGLAGYGCGYWLAGQAEALWQLYLCVGLLGGFGTSAIGMVPSSALISRWFRARLTTAMSIAYAALGIGVLLLVPFTQLSIEQHGWRESYRLLGLLLLGVLPLALLLPWRRLAAGAAPTGGDRRAAELGWTLRRAVASGAFWACFAVFFFTSVAVFAVTPQAVVYLVEVGFEPLTAAGAFGFISTLAVVGMITVALLADRFGRRRVVTVSYVFTAAGIVALLALQLTPSALLLALFVLLFGLVQGSRGPVVFALAARLFPGPGLGAIYGTITLGMGAGAATGAWVSGLLHDWSGGYNAGFGLGIVAAVAGAVLFWLVPALNDRPVGDGR